MMHPDNNWYYRGCKFTWRYLSKFIKDHQQFKKNSEKVVSSEYKNSLIYTGFDLEPYETTFFSYVGATFILFCIILIDALLFRLVNFSSGIIASIIIITLIIPFAVMWYLSEYVKIHARYLKITSLGDMPEVMSYVIMSMKIIPNMEKAVYFAAENSNRPLARDLKKMLWNLHLRIYAGMDDAVVQFSDMWGKNSEHFKRSLHLIKSSMSETDFVQRTLTLNRSLDIILDGTKNLMENYAAKLKLPTYILYSIFILIPLALVALLPAMAVVGIKITSKNLILIYNIIFPILTFAYAEYVLMQRPAAFVPQQIPPTHPELENLSSKKKKGLILGLIAGGSVYGVGYFLLFAGNPHSIISTGVLEGIVPTALLILIGISIAVSLYLNAAYGPYKRIRDKIIAMENEFVDALFILARRISEGRSAEEAFLHTATNMKGSSICEPFEQIAMNIVCMRCDLQNAVFDEDYGAFKNIHSERINTTMKLFLESVHKSHETAGVAIVKLADHMKDLQDVERRIKESLYEMTSTMKSTACIFAPLIGGITIALSEVIAKILQDVAHSISKLPPNMIPGPADISPQSLELSISTNMFMLEIGIYLILITIILTRFSTAIEYGGDKSQMMYELSRALPISIIVFSVSAIASRIIFRGFI